MSSVLKLMFCVALALFGAIAARAAPTYAAESYDCDGRSDQLCYTKTRETCARRTVCGVGFFNNIPYAIGCCAEYDIVEDYYYYRHAGLMN
ncbi:MAG: hypothetical protein ACREMQ_17855 [Longimicrobiales bacterium]